MGRHTRYLPVEDHAIKTLISGNIDPVVASVIMGRTPRSLAEHAKKLVPIGMPHSWRSLLHIKVRRGEKPELLQFPYIAKPRAEHSDLLRVNDIVPKTFPEWQRADICQSIMLAIFEGKTSISELESYKGNARYFIKEYYKKQQPWEELLGLGAGDDERSYDDIAVSRSSSLTERAAMPTQVEEVYIAQIKDAHRRFNEKGSALSVGEVAELLGVDQ